MPSAHRPAPFRGLAAGIAAGLIASFAMDQFQKLWTKAWPLPDTGDDPATVKAAQTASRLATGESLQTADKAAAGSAVHYLFGAALGGAYGLLAEYWPAVTKGFGSRLAVSAATLFDEIAVPAAGLSDPPTETPAVTHAYAYASHLLFGVTTEGIRRLIRTSDPA